MFRIRRVYDDITPANKEAIEQVPGILEPRFPGLLKRDIARLPEGIDGGRYRAILQEALRRVARFGPGFLVVPLGLDTAREDQTGTWSLEAEDFEAVGEMIGLLHFPTLVVQEGGYDTRVLGVNARHFFTGLWNGAYGA